MNNTRRGKLSNVIDTLNEALVELQSLSDEEDDVRMGMEGTNLEFTRNYDKSDQACELLTEALDHLEAAISGIETAIE